MSFDRREKLTGAKLFALGLKKTEKNGEREIRTLDADYST